MPRYLSADEMAQAARIWDAERSFELEWQFYHVPHEKNRKPALGLSTELPMHERPPTPPPKSMMSPFASPFTPQTTTTPPEIRLQEATGEQCEILFSPQAATTAIPAVISWPEVQPAIQYDSLPRHLSNSDAANQQRSTEATTSSQRLDHVETQNGVVEHRILPLEARVQQLGSIVQQHGSLLWNHAQYGDAMQGQEENHFMPARREYGQPAGGIVFG